jgi:hypothetical protein
MFILKMWLQIGVHGDCIAQASRIRIVTDSPLPMQVDGEPCMLQASEIIIDLKNKANMIMALDDPNNNSSYGSSSACAQAVCSCKFIIFINGYTFL